MKRMIALAMVFTLSPVMSATEGKVLIGEMELEYCHIANYSQEVLCGTHEVAEDRIIKDGRKLQINFAVVPSVTEAKELDPLVFFAGGPGQGALDMGAFVSMAFQEIHENRDIVLIDQRGMGSSNPLNCEQPEDVELTLTDEQQTELMKGMLQECLTQLDADVTKYTQDLANQDIHEILLALGYDKVNLYGVSWGTRSALLYVNQFPEQVRTAIMDGVAPLENRVPLFANADAERAIQTLFKDCEDNKDCQSAFPTLKQDFYQVLKAFGENGHQVTMNDANTGDTVTFLITRNTFVNSIRNILYVPEYSRLIPIIIQQAKVKDFRALSGLTAAFGDGGMAMGTQMSVLCSEDFSRISDKDIASETDKGFVGDGFINYFKTGCEVWPKAELPEIYNQTLTSDVPTLILSGAIDPVTPERWGEKMKEVMTNSIHLIAANTGHNVGPKGCAPDIMTQFVNQGHIKEIDGSCLDDLSRPSFFIDSNGPSSKVGLLSSDPTVNSDSKDLEESNKESKEINND